MEIALQAETLLSYDVGSVKGNNGNKISNKKTNQLFKETLFPHMSYGWHQIHKSSHTLIKGLWQLGSELMSKSEKVMSDVHAVVMMQSRQLR